MQRRQALKLIASAATLPLLSRDAFSLFQEVHQQLGETAALKTLNAHQNATVTMLSELIIPQTETPGAKAARVNEFIDVMLSGWYDDDDKAIFLNGLADVDKRSQDLFGKDFVACSGKQQTEILVDLDEELSERREPVTPLRQSQIGPPERHFFYMMKHLTLVGYYTSEVGFTEELHQQVIPPRHAGCVSIDEASE